MIFDKNQEYFPTKAHEAIWDTGIHIIPLEVTLPHEIRDNLPSYMIESCVQLHNFFLHMLKDLYENPEIYEPFLYVRCAIHFKFFTPFAEFSLVGEVGEDYLSINRFAFDKLLLKQIKSKSYQKEGNYKPITAEHRIDQLKRTAIEIHYEGNNVTMKNLLYPNMFYAMREMAQVALNEKGSGDNSFTYCDFRKLYKNYKYDKYENALVFLNDVDKSIAKQLDNIAKKLKLSRSIKSGHCPSYDIMYKYKSGILMNLNCMGSRLTMFIRFLYNKKNDTPIYNLFDAIEKDSDELKKFVYRRLPRCIRCYHGCPGYADVGFPMRIYGKMNKMCIYTDRMGILMPKKNSKNYFVQLDEIPFIEKVLLYAKNLSEGTFG